MRILLFVAFLVIFAECAANGTKTTKKGHGEPVVCNQYIGQGAVTSDDIKKLDEKLDQLIKLLQPSPYAASTCKEIYDKNLSKGNKQYLLNVGSAKIPVYCHMAKHGLDACGGGGWTLVMKIDGSKKTFHYNSKLWSNKVDFNLPGGKTGLDTHETKLPTYWNTPFDKICLGMKIGHQFKSVVINHQARSLYSLIADGKYRATSLGRNTWKKLIGSRASLQPNCNKEGFNVISTIRKELSKARIGILGNNENDCSSCDSRIGFGTGGNHNESNTCGNEAVSGGDNGDQHIKAMGYILVQ
ncbi:uncharacterized skeletal organic matrix protein 5-like [Porites lutea]|uniref:uncharacterized skeletal organic matrix protein 5-like n=1 Tax=Porites lutea TaxID=51062 RepID=UPI003CC5463D